MRLIFSIFTAIVLIIAALVFVAPMFISIEEMRNQLFAQVESRTGYRLRVSGPVDISLFPSVDLVAEDVGVAQPSAEDEFATAKTLRFRLMLSGLLQGNVRVREVTLIDPVIAVPQKSVAPGAPQGAATDGAQPNLAPSDSSDRKSGLAGIAEQLKTIALDKVVIENGTVILPPSGAEPGKRIERLDLNASLPGYDAPLSLETSAVIDGKALQAQGSIGNFGPFLEGSPAPVQITASAPDMLDAPLNLSGTASYENDTLALPQFSAKSGDKTLSGTAVYKDDTAKLSQFTATVGGDTFAGNATYKDNVVTVNPLRANVRGSVMDGQVQANLANNVPYVVAALAAKTLDIDAITQTVKSKPGKSGGGSGGSNEGGRKERGAWSNKKIDFSPLKAINGKFSISAEQLIYGKVKISPVTLQATLDGGRLNAHLSKFNIYGGAGNAAVAIDASGETPAQRVTLTVANFDAYPLLKDTAGFQRLDGRGTVSVDLSAYGASQQAIVSALGGNASIEVADGAIRGVNVAKMIRSLGTGVVQGWQGGTAEKTDFASLGATLQIDKGIATTQDLHLVGPLVRVSGSGTVDLPAKGLNLRVEPQLVASLEGQGAQKDVAGVGVPVMIVGPWSKPKFYPDIKGILEDPVAAYERLKQFGDGVSNLPGLDGDARALSNVIKDGKVDKDALIQGIGGLLGGTQAAPSPEEPVSPETQTVPTAQPDPAATAQPDAASAAEPEQAQPVKKKKKKKKKRAEKKPDIEDAAKQLLENFLSGQ